MYPYHSAIILSPGSRRGIARVNKDLRVGITILMPHFPIPYPAQRLHDQDTANRRTVFTGSGS